MHEFAEIDRAIRSHSRWKLSLRTVVKRGVGAMSLENAQSDMLCDFGRWLYSLSDEERKSAHWREVQRLHKDFHLAAARIFHLVLEGREKEAEDFLNAKDGDFYRFSYELTKAMRLWKMTLSKF
jgi:hypothetical protein